jgi:hypothetical protein
MFDARVASRELRRFRRNGARRTTRDLCEGVCLHCADASTVLDIGPGIGALTCELREAAVQNATDVARRIGIARAQVPGPRRAGFALARRLGKWVWGADIYIRDRMAPKS